MKKIAILIILLCTIVGCSNVLLNQLCQDYIERYKQPPATDQQFDGAMTLFFNTYPEFHITRRIYEQSIFSDWSSPERTTEAQKRLGLMDSINFEYLFFREDRKYPNGDIWPRYNIVSNQKNIFTIWAGNWSNTENLEFWGKFSIFFYYIAFQKDNYKWKRLGDLTRAESNAAEAEFETDILPKIQECLEIVKERDKAKEEEK